MLLKLLDLLQYKNNQISINLPFERFDSPNQNGCKVIITVTLWKDEQLTPQQQQLITKHIKENIYPDDVNLLNIDFQISKGKSISR